MYLDVDAVKDAPDTRPLPPARIVSANVAPVEDAEALADSVGDWWEQKLNRPLWANTWEARVQGRGIQQLKVPRFPVWEDPPVVSRINSDGTNGGAYDATEIRVQGKCRKLLYREPSWPWDVPLKDDVVGTPLAGLEDYRLLIGPDPNDANVVGFRAGFVMPGERLRWTATTEWGVGASTSNDSGTAYGWAQASSRTVPGLFEVTAGAGGVEAAEPIWPTVDGDEVVAANNTFTLRLHAAPLPAIFETASLIIARMLRAGAGGGKLCTKDRAHEMKIVQLAMGSC